METSQITLSFANISGKMIEADFDGGTTTSDGGALLLRQAEARTGIVDRIVAAMSDRRHQSYIDHTYTDLIRQRVFQIACGYEDANDSDDLRCDPGLKTACDRLPLTGDDLASQPTMSRLENSVSRSDLYRIGLALLEIFIESYDQPPKKLTIDIDDTDDPTHGAQQLTLFHAYYDEYCYLPVHLYEGESGKLITTLPKSWPRPRQIIYKAEITQGKANPRFVVTNIRNRTPEFLYEKVYCARGRSEGFIKNHKTYLQSDRTSCHRFSANQFRLFLHSAAYVLLHTIQQIGMRGTQWTTSNFDTIQLCVLKVGARVREQATKVRFHFPTSYPLKDLMRTVVRNLDTS